MATHQLGSAHLTIPVTIELELRAAYPGQLEVYNDPDKEPVGGSLHVSQDRAVGDRIYLSLHSTNPDLRVARDGSDRVVAMWNHRVNGSVMYCDNAACKVETFRTTSRRYPQSSPLCPGCSGEGVLGGEA